MVLVFFLLFMVSCGTATSNDDEERIGINDEYDAGDTVDSAYYDDSDSESYGGGDYSDTGDTVDTGDTYYDDNGEYSGDYGDTADSDYYGDEEEPPYEQPKVGDLIENEWVETSVENTSTFSIDVDTASYTQVRNYLMNYHYMPPANIVRIEEMVNYFDYKYPQPEEGRPFSVTMEMADSPWRSDTKLIMFGLQGKNADPDSIVASNLVFLIDVSGSMAGEKRIGLLKKSFKKLVEKLGADDTVSIVTYASGVKTVLDSASGDDKKTIISAIDSLVASGATSGGDGLKRAYELAEKNYSKDANNRIILATDGDFNVGMSSTEELVAYIETERNKGIYLTILGFGMGNYQDDKMEQLSNAGNGNYFYVDDEKAAEKIFTFDLMGTLFTIAKDVKLQVVFNPEKIAKYRLVGYENRVMANEDFNDDTKDAGEIGAGHRVTAFYEVFLTDKQAETETPDENDGEDTEVGDDEGEIPDEDEAPAEVTEPEIKFGTGDFLLLKMRYKEPDEEKSMYMDTYMNSDNVSEEMSENMGFASAVVEFGMLLRHSKFRENSSYDSVLERAQENIGSDPFGYRGEFLEMVEIARTLAY